MGFYPAFPGEEENRLASKFTPFLGDFFAQFWGPRDGPKATDGHHVSA